MWHASSANHRPEVCRHHAHAALEGVGAEGVGQWIEDNTASRGAYHLRRRISEAEAKEIGDFANPCDIRGTPDAKRRLLAVKRYLPVGWIPE